MIFEAATPNSNNSIESSNFLEKRRKSFSYTLSSKLYNVLIEGASTTP